MNLFFNNINKIKIKINKYRILVSRNQNNKDKIIFCRIMLIKIKTMKKF